MPESRAGKGKMYSDLKYAEIQTVIKNSKCLLCQYVSNYHWTIEGVCVASCESCGADSCDIREIKK